MMTMRNVDMNQFIELYGAAIPLSILIIDNEADKYFLISLYLESRPLMYQTVAPFFPRNEAEIDDTIGNAVERLCKNHGTLQKLERNQLQAYIVLTCKRVCFDRKRELLDERAKRDYAADMETIGAVPDNEDTYGHLFADLTGAETLAVFPELSDRERDMFLMKHVEGLSCAQIAQIFHMSEGAVRTALARTKKKLLKLATLKKWKGTREKDE